MKVTAIYKTFDGEEFVGASLASIYEHVDRIIMVHSDVSWTGQRGNTAQSAAAAWCDLYDYAGKVHHVSVSAATQEDQYKAAIDYIVEHELTFDVAMIVDCDEVWEDANLSEALQRVRKTPDGVAFSTEMRTYIKTPFYRIHSKWGTPTVFLRDLKLLLSSARAWEAPNIVPLGPLHFHHFSCVRASREAVRRKIEASCAGDGSERLVDLDEWFRDKWDRLPVAINLHPFAGREDLWDRIVKVWLSDLPPAVVQDTSIMARYLPPGEFPEDESLLRNLAAGVDLAVDLGTYHGRSAVVLSTAAKRVVTIDQFERIVGRNVQGDWGKTYDDLYRSRPYKFAAVRRWLAQYGNIEARQGDTANASEDFEPRSVGLVFIDADHSTVGVTRDFFAWLPKIKRDGVVVFHDVNDVHPAVKEFIERAVVPMPDMVPVDLGKKRGSLRAFRKVS